MKNIVIMVHQDFFEKNLRASFGRLLDVQVTLIPRTEVYDLEAIKIVIAQEVAPLSSVDYFIFEANYGESAKGKVNNALLDFLINTYPDAQLVAFSGTPAALARALEANPKLYVMPKGHNHEEAESEIMAELTVVPSPAISPKKSRKSTEPQSPRKSPQMQRAGVGLRDRIYTQKELMEEIIHRSTRARPKSEIFKRSSPPTTPVHQRRNSFVDMILPLFSALRLTSESTSSPAPAPSPANLHISTLNVKTDAPALHSDPKDHPEVTKRGLLKK